MRRVATATAGVLVGIALAAGPAHANSPPVLQPDFYRLPSTKPTLTVKAPGFLANDLDPDGDKLTALLLSGTSNGTLDFSSYGRFTYTPDPGFSGLDQFDYFARDDPQGVYQCCGHGYIVVTQPPVAHDDSYGAVNTARRTVDAPGLLANDERADRARLADPPDHGRVDVRYDGRFLYRADPGFVGTDTFTYEALVTGEPPSLATVSMRVKASNASPAGSPDTYFTQEDTQISEAAPGVLANDTDADGDPLTAEVVNPPFGEYFEMLPDGSFEYQPPTDYDSPVQFTYRVSDGTTTSPPVTATIEISALSDPPVAVDDEYYYDIRNQRSFEVGAPGVLGNDFDPVEGDQIYATLLNPPSLGRVQLRRDGSFSYEHRNGATGTDGFSYVTSDSGGAQGGVGYVTIYDGTE